jgi:hypothetical protein
MGRMVAVDSPRVNPFSLDTAIQAPQDLITAFLLTVPRCPPPHVSRTYRAP